MSDPAPSPNTPRRHPFAMLWIMAGVALFLLAVVGISFWSTRQAAVKLIALASPASDPAAACTASPHPVLLASINQAFRQPASSSVTLSVAQLNALMMTDPAAAAFGRHAHIRRIEGSHLVVQASVDLQQALPSIKADDAHRYFNTDLFFEVKIKSSAALARNTGFTIELARVVQNGQDIDSPFLGSLRQFSLLELMLSKEELTLAQRINAVTLDPATQSITFSLAPGGAAP